MSQIFEKERGEMGGRWGGRFQNPLGVFAVSKNDQVTP